MLNREQTGKLIKEIIAKQGITDLKTGRWLLMKELMAWHRSKLDWSLVNEIISSMI
jgi:hypothetical protein